VISIPWVLPIFHIKKLLTVPTQRSNGCRMVVKINSYYLVNCMKRLLFVGETVHYLRGTNYTFKHNLD